MLTAADWAEMAANLAAVRGDNETSITIRRGSSTLDPQPVRIARMGSVSQERDSAGAQQVTGRVVVLGSTTFDVRPGDRFNDGDGTLYRVTFVRPNRRAAVVAEAEAVE
jgi:hypothetical protein